MPTPATLLRPPALAAALALATLAAHAPGLANGFVWDDLPIVVENPDTRDLGALPRVVLSPDQTAPYYRPLNRASYLLDHALFGLDPRAFHAVSLLLHVAAVLALFAVGLRLFAAPLPAALAALLFALHPVTVEAVAFVSARNNLLALLFSLAALALFADAVRRGSARRAWASGAALLLGLLSKEQAAMTLPALAAWLWIVEGRGPRAWLAAWRLAVPHACAVAVYASLRTIALAGEAAPAASTPSLATRLAEAALALPRLLALAAFPHPLTIFHGPGEGSALAHPAALAVAWLAIAGVAVLVVRRRSAPATFGLAWLGLQLVPLAGLVAIPTTTRVAERYLYLALAGVALVAADAVVGAVRRWPRARPLALAGTAAVLAAFAARTADRTGDWRDDVTLTRAAVETDPSSAEARFNLGVALKDRGDLAGARGEWEAALRAEPGHARALTQLGTLHAVQGRLAEAEGLLRAAIAADPSVGVAHLNLARILERTGRPAEAREHYAAFVRTASDLERPLVEVAEARLRALAP